MAENKKKDTKYDGMTASKAKRERAKDEREAAKRASTRNKVILVAVCAAIVGLIVAFNVMQWYKEKNRTHASTDYSAMLNEDGTIQGVNVADYVKTFDVNGVKIARADVEYTDEEMQEDINAELEEHMVLSDDKNAAIADGDEVSIDYVGTMDGVEFEGGSAQDYRLAIGSGSFIDDFEEQLIGHHPGEKVTVNVTFPDPYENNPDYAGKDAAFDVTIKGIYQKPTYDDNFVKETLASHGAEVGQTVAEFEQYLKDTHYKEKLSSAVDTYISENISAESYPADYIKHLKSLQMTLNEQNFDYMKQMYAAYGMNFDYDSVMAYYNAATADDYEKVLQEAAEETCLNNMAYQDLAAQAGITVTDEQYDAFITENEVSEEAQETYGKGYLIQQYILPDLVKDYIAEHATVE